MKHKPYNLTALTGAVLLLLGVFFPATQPPQAAAISADEANPQASAAPAGQPGTELLSQVREKLKALDSLKCDIHQTAVFSGMKFTAVGRYLQSTGNRFRIEYQIFPIVTAKASDAIQPVSDDAADPKSNSDGEQATAIEARGILTQVSDGSVLFTYWKNGDDTRVTRRNISDILKASAEVSQYDATRAVQDLGLGGFSALIARLQNTMEFSRVRTEQIGNAEFLVVTGRWNRDVRQRMFQLPDDAVVIPQEFIPEFVRLYIDARTLLPRRIQYLKHFPDPSQKQWRPLVTIDLRQIVLNDTVDDAKFAFSAPEGVVEEDITEMTIQGIRQSLPIDAAAPNPAAPASAVQDPGVPGAASEAADSPIQPRSDGAPKK